MAINNFTQRPRGISVEPVTILDIESFVTIAPEGKHHG